jgi:dihydroorotate dehydrogenase electron transfer subunit
MKIEQSKILEHRRFSGDYRILMLESPGVAAAAQPGQFVHVHVPRLEARVLRRPFSLYRAEGEALSILYKAVGKGTQAMTELQPGTSINLIGPLGNGFPLEGGGKLPVLVAGGYGVAPLYFLATRLAARGILFVGGATAKDVLCVADFKALGWDVRIATEDGSLGTRGRVTAVLDAWSGPEEGGSPVLYACGPDGMLKAVGQRAAERGWKGWLSLDKHMGCGVGACLACVQKIKVPGGKVVWARVCREGPVFEAADIVWS